MGNGLGVVKDYPPGAFGLDAYTPKRSRRRKPGRAYRVSYHSIAMALGTRSVLLLGYEPGRKLNSAEAAAVVLDYQRRRAAYEASHARAQTLLEALARDALQDDSGNESVHGPGANQGGRPLAPATSTRHCAALTCIGRLPGKRCECERL